MKIYYAILVILSVKSYAQGTLTEQEAVRYLTDNFVYCESYTAELYYRQNAEVEIKSVKIVNERLRIVESKIFFEQRSSADTTSQEIYIPFKSIKKISIVYNEFANQPKDGLIDISYVIGRKHSHNYLYFNWNAVKGMKEDMINALNVLVAACKDREREKEYEKEMEKDKSVNK
jgi:hypothetical protein